MMYEEGFASRDNPDIFHKLALHHLILLSNLHSQNLLEIGRNENDW